MVIGRQCTNLTIHTVQPSLSVPEGDIPTPVSHIIPGLSHAGHSDCVTFMTCQWSVVGGQWSVFFASWIVCDISNIGWFYFEVLKDGLYLLCFLLLHILYSMIL